MQPRAQLGTLLGTQPCERSRAAAAAGRAARSAAESAARICSSLESQPELSLERSLELQPLLRAPSATCAARDAAAEKNSFTSCAWKAISVATTVCHDAEVMNPKHA